MDLISVIVPIYKVAEYLPMCIESIQKQTYNNLQIILVDDGSPDECGEICDRYAEKDSRVYVIHKPNGGLSDARNAGIEAARGQWLMFIDGDDYIAPAMAETLITAAKQQDAEMAIGSVVLFRDANEGRIVRDDLMVVDDGVLSGVDILKMAGKHTVIPGVYVVACNKIYRKELFAEIRYPIGVFHEDEAIAHYLFGACERVVCVSDRVYYYRQTPGSIMNQTYSIKRLDAFQAYADRICFYEHSGLSEFTPPMQDRFFWELLEKYYLFEQTTENRRALARCRIAAGRVLPHYTKRRDVPLKLKITMIIFRYCPNLYRKLWKK